MDESTLRQAVEKYDESLHGLIRELLEEYFIGEGSDVPIDALAVRRNRIEDRIERLEQQKEDISSEIQSLEHELEIIDNLIQDIGDDYIATALEKCSTIHQRQRVPTNEAIQTQAEKVGIPPQQFIELLNEKYPTNKFGEPESE